MPVDVDYAKKDGVAIGDGPDRAFERASGLTMAAAMAQIFSGWIRPAACAPTGAW